MQIINLLSLPLLGDSPPSASLHCASGGRSFPSDATGAGQRGLSLSASCLQAEMRQEKPRIRLAHRQILRETGHGTGERLTGKPPGM